MTAGAQPYGNHATLRALRDEGKPAKAPRRKAKGRAAWVFPATPTVESERPCPEFLHSGRGFPLSAGTENLPALAAAILPDLRQALGALEVALLAADRVLGVQELAGDARLTPGLKTVARLEQAERLLAFSVRDLEAWL